MTEPTEPTLTTEPVVPAYLKSGNPQPSKVGLIWHHRVPQSVRLRHGMTAQGLVDRIVALENYGFVVLEPHKPLLSRLWRAWRMGAR